MVRAVRAGRTASGTRLVLEVEGTFRYRSEASPDGRSIVVEIPDAVLSRSAPRFLPVADPRVDGVILQADPRAGSVRVSVDVAGRVAPRLVASAEGSRLILDLVAPGMDSALPASPRATAETPKAGAEAGMDARNSMPSRRNGLLEAAAHPSTKPRLAAPAPRPAADDQEDDDKVDEDAPPAQQRATRVASRPASSAAARGSRGAVLDGPATGPASSRRPASVASASPSARRPGSGDPDARTASAPSRASDADAAGARPASRSGTATRTTSSRRSVVQRPVVVLDPGHGGKDPGARSWTGEWEKDIVLDLAERVARRLRARGDVEVVMTRADDQFVALPDRRDASRRWGADVFVSIHANASRNAAASGIETYYHAASSGGPGRSSQDDRSIRRLARAENGGRAGRPVRTGGLAPASLAAGRSPFLDRERESARLARLVQGQLVRQLGMRYDSVRDLGAKEGPFFVIGENAAPSILVEAAFLTHREEGLRMRSEVYREQLAEGVARGIVAFLDGQRRSGSL